MKSKTEFVNTLPLYRQAQRVYTKDKINSGDVIAEIEHPHHSPFKYIEHNHKPNTVLRDRTLVAIADIGAGEVVTTNRDNGGSVYREWEFELHGDIPIAQRYRWGWRVPFGAVRLTNNNCKEFGPDIEKKYHEFKQ